MPRCGSRLYTSEIRGPHSRAAPVRHAQPPQSGWEVHARAASGCLRTSRRRLAFDEEACLRGHLAILRRLVCEGACMCEFVSVSPPRRYEYVCYDCIIGVTSFSRSRPKPARSPTECLLSCLSGGDRRGRCGPSALQIITGVRARLTGLRGWCAVPTLPYL